MRKSIFALIIAIGTTLYISSCKDDEDTSVKKSSDTESIEMLSVSELSSNKATLTLTKFEFGKGTNSRAIIYSTSADFANQQSVAFYNETAPINITITKLSPQTTYYAAVRVSYNDGTTKYSATLQFTTTEATASNLDNYEAPTYADDYRSISDWSQRANWNLANVHDPSVVLADDGYYYMYQTDASYGNVHVEGGHFHARRSKNLVDWEYMGGIMDAAPEWVLSKCNEYRTAIGLEPITNPQYGYWAPCVRKVENGLYRMYYSIVIDNYIGNGKPNNDANYDGTWTERAFIGLMETADPSTNMWKDKGFVICSSSDKSTDYKRTSKNDWNGYFYFNAIDPSYIVTPEGEHWLIYGSWHSGIAAVQLDPQTGKTLHQLGNPYGTLSDIEQYGKLIYTRKSNDRWQASEGPEIIYRNGYYYLFLAYDALDVPYNTRVVRATKIDGPYYNINDEQVTNGGDALPIITHPYKFDNSQGWVGISHCAVWCDNSDNWYFASQARFPENHTGNAPNAVMLGHVRQIIWTDDNWPLVLPERYGAVPQLDITADEIIGNWSYIDLSYQYKKIDASTALSFNDNGTTSGALTTTWTFDASTQTISLGSNTKLYLRRETDWEATPRRHTIVFAGLNGAKTYWGKKN